ncbi:PEP-CTERM sorting domain-containing protein [Roseateles saccharophilus]|nr:PEP-CTERM sorting domain-containing protein [Roseateles saccharophilus]
MTKPLACSLIAAALFASGSAHANLVTNGDFETGDFSGWITVLDPLYDSVTGVAPVPQAGLYGASFGGAKSSISQTIATVAGANYVVSFWLQLEADVTGADQPNAFSFDFGGATGTSLVNASAFGYTPFEATFIASSASTDLTFNFSEGPAFWDIDSIQVKLPEPGSIALLVAAGLGGAVATRRRKTAGTSA